MYGAWACLRLRTCVALLEIQVFDEFDELDFYSKVKSTPSVDDDDDRSDSERTSPTNPSARPNTLTALAYNQDRLQDMKALKCQVDSFSSWFSILNLCCCLYVIYFEYDKVIIRNKQSLPHSSCYSSRDNSPKRELGCVGSPTRAVRMSTSSSFWRVSDAREEHVKMLEDQLQVLAAFPRLFLLSFPVFEFVHHDTCGIPFTSFCHCSLILVCAETMENHGAVPHVEREKYACL